MDIVEVDPFDELALRDWYAVEQAVIASDRPHGVGRSWRTLTDSVLRPGRYYRRDLLAARDDEGCVGIAELGGSTQDNQHLADLQIAVLPARRGQGVGGALWEEADRRRRADGRTTVCAELHVPHDAQLSVSPGHRFAAALGFASVHREEHLVLGLPVERGRLERLQASTRGADYDIVTWGDRCPDDQVEAFCLMQTQMANDLPLGEVDYRPVVVDEERVRVQEERRSRSFHCLTAAARRRSDGTMAGYSYLFLAHDDREVIQDDTLVMPEHRGHGLGRAMKLATLELVRTRHPDRTRIHTYTDPSNHPMLKTNLAFGFLAVETMHEMQRRDD